jgi:hypothetical protein
METEVLQYYNDLSDDGKIFVDSFMNEKYSNEWSIKISTNKRIENSLISAITRFYKKQNAKEEKKKEKQEKQLKKKLQREDDKEIKRLAKLQTRSDNDMEAFNKAEGRIEAELFQNIENKRFKSVKNQKNIVGNIRPLEDKLNSFVSNELTQDSFQRHFFPDDYLEKLKVSINNNTKVSRSCTGNTYVLNPNQQSVYYLAKLRALDRINTPGLLVKHGTGAGKTIIAVLILLAFWNKRTPEGKLWTIILASTIQNQRHDNNIEVLSKHCINYFSDFQAEVEKNKELQPIFSRQYYERQLEQEGFENDFKTHIDFVKALILKRISDGISDTFIRRKISGNDDINAKIDNYKNRRLKDGQLGLSFYGMLGYDLGTNMYTFDQFNFKRQATETQQKYVEIAQKNQKKILQFVNYFFLPKEARLQNAKYYPFRDVSLQSQKNKTFRGKFDNDPIEYTTNLVQINEIGEGRKKITTYSAVYPPLVNDSSEIFIPNFALRLQEEGNLTNYINKEVYPKLENYIDILLGVGETFHDVGLSQIKDNLKPVFQKVLQNIFNVKFERGHYTLNSDEEFHLQNLNANDPDESEESFTDFEDSIKVSTEDQEKEIEEEFTEEPYLQMNTERKIQNCVFIFDEIQVLFDVPSSEFVYRHKYRQLIHFMKYYRDPETTWVVGLTATPGSTINDVAELMSMLETIEDIRVPKSSGSVIKNIESIQDSLGKKQFVFTKPGIFRYDNVDYKYINSKGSDVILRQENSLLGLSVEDLADYIQKESKVLVSYVDFSGDRSMYPRVSFERKCISLGSEEETDSDEDSDEDSAEDSEEEDSYIELMKKYEIEDKILARLVKYENEHGTTTEKLLGRNMFIQMNGFYGVAEFHNGEGKLLYIPYDNEHKIDEHKIIDGYTFFQEIKVTKKEIYTVLTRANLYLNIPKQIIPTTYFGLKVNIKKFAFNYRQTEKDLIPSNKIKTVVQTLLNAIFNKDFTFKKNPGKHYVYCSDTIGMNIIAYLLKVYSGNRLLPLTSSKINETLSKNNNKFGLNTPPQSKSLHNSNNIEPSIIRSVSKSQRSGNSNSNTDETNVKSPKAAIPVIQDEPRYYLYLDSRSSSRSPLNEAYFPLTAGELRNAKLIAGSKRIPPTSDGKNYNLYGDIVPVIFATGESYKGVDMSAVTHIHVVDAFLDFQNFLQLVGRGPRTCSHVLLKPSERKVNVIIYHNNSYISNVSKKIGNLTKSIQNFEYSSDKLLWERSISDYRGIWEILNNAFAKKAIDRNVFENTFHKKLTKQMEDVLGITCNSLVEEEQEQRQVVERVPKVVKEKKETSVVDLQEFLMNSKGTYTHVSKYYDFDGSLFKIKNKNVMVKIPLSTDHTTPNLKAPITFGYEKLTGTFKKTLSSFFESLNRIIDVVIEKKSNLSNEFMDVFRKQRDHLKKSYEIVKNMNVQLKKNVRVNVKDKDEGVITRVSKNGIYYVKLLDGDKVIEVPESEIQQIYESPKERVRQNENFGKRRRHRSKFYMKIK